MRTVYAPLVCAALSGCQSFGDFMSAMAQDPAINNQLSSHRIQPTEFQVQPVNTQPYLVPNSKDANGYELFMVNTSSGWVHRRCKVLNGKAVACL